MGVGILALEVEKGMWVEEERALFLSLTPPCNVELLMVFLHNN